MADVITYLCDACDRRLEVDAYLLGRKAACPYCGNIAVVRRRSVGPAKAPAVVEDADAEDGGARGVGRGAGGGGRVDGDGRAGAGGGGETALRSDRAAAMGLPPDAGPEVHVLTVHPVTIRAHPWRGFGVVFGIAASIAGAVWLYGVSRQEVGSGGAGESEAGSGAGTSAGSGAGVPGWFEDAGGWGTVSTVGMYACIVLAMAGLVTLGVWWVLKRSVALIITNRRTTLRQGLFSRHSREVLHDRVQDIQVTQTFVQRVLRTGTLGISNSGDAGIEIEAHDLPNPVRLRTIIDAYRGSGGGGT